MDSYAVPPNGLRVQEAVSDFPAPERLVTDADGWTVLNPAWVAFQRDLVMNGSKHVPPAVNGWHRGSASGNAGLELHLAFKDEAVRRHERFLVEQTVKLVVRELKGVVPPSSQQAPDAASPEGKGIGRE